MTIKNAIIEKAEITCGDRSHGCLSISITVDYGDSGHQGFGGWSLGGRSNWTTEKNYGGRWLLRCMEIADVDEWSDMTGKTIRVAIENDLIVGIGHIVKENWLYPKSEFGGQHE